MQNNINIENQHSYQFQIDNYKLNYDSKIENKEIYSGHLMISDVNGYESDDEASSSSTSHGSLTSTEKNIDNNLLPNTNYKFKNDHMLDLRHSIDICDFIDNKPINMSEKVNMGKHPIEIKSSDTYNYNPNPNYNIGSENLSETTLKLFENMTNSWDSNDLEINNMQSFSNEAQYIQGAQNLNINDKHYNDLKNIYDINNKHKYFNMMKKHSLNNVFIDASLSRLFKCMTLAYNEKPTSPRWNWFRGLKLQLKDKLRLNNVIWRAWHMQFIFHVKPPVFQFEVTFDEKIPQIIILEGSYWKRRLDTVIAEYRKWRVTMRERMIFHHKLEFTKCTFKLDHKLPNILKTSNIMHQTVSGKRSHILTNTLLKRPSIPLQLQNYFHQVDDITNMNLNVKPTLVDHCRAKTNLQSSSEYYIQNEIKDFINFGDYSSYPLSDDILNSDLSLTNSPFNVNDFCDFYNAYDIQDLCDNNDIGSLGLDQDVGKEPFLPLLEGSKLSGKENHFCTSSGSISNLNINPKSNNKKLKNDNESQYRIKRSVNNSSNIDYDIQEARFNFISRNFIQPGLTKIHPNSGSYMDTLEPLAEIVKSAKRSYQHILENACDNNSANFGYNDFDTLKAVKSAENKGLIASKSHFTPYHDDSLPIISDHSKSINSSTIESQTIESNPKISDEFSTLCLKNVSSYFSQVLMPPRNSPIPSTISRSIPHIMYTSNMKNDAVTISNLNHAIDVENYNHTSSTLTQANLPFMTSVATGNVTSQTFSPQQTSYVLCLLPSDKITSTLTSNQISFLAPTPLTSFSTFREVSDDDSGITLAENMSGELILINGNTLQANHRFAHQAPIFVLNTPSSISNSQLQRVMLMQDPTITANKHISNFERSTSNIASSSDIITWSSRLSHYRKIAPASQLNKPSSSFNYNKDSFTFSNNNKDLMKTNLIHNFKHLNPPLEHDTSNNKFRLYNEPRHKVTSESPIDITGIDSLQKRRRFGHVNAEHKRRCCIKSGFDALLSTVPWFYHGANTKASKVAILSHTAEYTKHLRRKITESYEELSSLRMQIAALNREIGHYQSCLTSDTDNGPLDSDTIYKSPPLTLESYLANEKQILERNFEKYLENKCTQNWKFYIFSLFSRPFFTAYNDYVSTSSIQELCSSVTTWLDQFFTLPIMRPVASKILVELSTKTSILTSPNEFSDQIKSLILRSYTNS
ncbi:unnamed protein product [Gordionus sp. m RMFG-2023]|uniref:uncharacterized protein LOC135931128 isoform X2 n=1 Tax=Gordionus sp. m RMFG-2023 TaxID=3053472 RepID=UPI0030E41B4E